MSFTANIPATGQSLGNSRTQVLNNFAILRSSLATDHVDVNLAGNGKHKFVRIPSSMVPPATGVTEWAIFTKTLTNLEIWVQPPNNAAAYALTASQIGPANIPNGISYLPGGAYIQWGSVAAPAASGNVIFPAQFPSNVFSITLSLQATLFNEAVLINNAVPPNTTGFAYITGGTASVLYWMAIGN